MALVIALVMVLGMSTMAMASGNDDTITINNAKPGETYKIYKLFDLVVDSDENPTAYSYTVATEWADFFSAGDSTVDPAVPAGAGYQYVTINDAGYVTAISDAAALAKAAAAATTGKKGAKTAITVGEGQTTAAFTGLEDGYYLITSTLGTIAMTETTPDKSAVTINEKNPEDTIEKKVKEYSTGEFGKSNDAQVGDTIEFQSTVKIVKGTRNVVVHDSMTSGLTYTAGSIVINGLTKGTEYTVNENPTDGDTFDITFTQSWIDNLDFGEAGYKEYVIAYTAVLNDKAVVKGSDSVAIVDQNNKTTVTYGDKQSKDSETTTKTHKFSVYKHDKDSTSNLAGAVFQLKKGAEILKLTKIDDTNYRIDPNGTETSFTTVSTGDIVIWGADSDSDYSLVETQAPAGYNKLTNPVSVTVDAGNSTRIDVENNKGAELPSTGGIGTTIFYIVGAILVVGAGVLLVTRRRMNAR